MQALPAAGESLCIIEMGGAETGDKSTTGNVGGHFLNIGLSVSVMRVCSTKYIAGSVKCRSY